MTSSRPYLLRAMYEWLVDNALTPYIMVDANSPSVAVPSRYVEDGKIVLNIDSQAVGALRMGNDAVEFDARFSGVAHHVYVPVPGVQAIYAFENGRGMVFGEEDESTTPPSCNPEAKTETKPVIKKGRPELKIIK